VIGMIDADVPLTFWDLSRAGSPDGAAQSVVIGIDRGGDMREVDAAAFDLILTTAPDAPVPFVSIGADQLDRHMELLQQAVARNPVAALMLCQTLRQNELADFEDGVIRESHAYSTLLGGVEFKHWLAGRPGGIFEQPTGPLIRQERDGDHLTISLDHAATRNGMSAAMRDQLFDALTNCIDDPTCPTVTLTGEGACFSTGGVLAEFGTATDLAEAHLIRTERSCARLIATLGDRIEVVFHGAAIGSGVEVAAAAARRIARTGAWFQMPELAMGLIPGAGGTVTLPRTIGRHRTAWMLLSGKRINAETALDWGLIDAIVPA
jgi:enoyl-CoA hydratase/carnithine racemase